MANCTQAHHYNFVLGVLSSTTCPSWQRNAKKPTRMVALRYFKSGSTGLAAELCSHNDPRMSVKSFNQLRSSPSLWVCKGIPAFHLFHKFLVPNPLILNSISSACKYPFICIQRVMTNLFLALFTSL